MRGPLVLARLASSSPFCPSRLNDELAIVQRDLQRLEETKAAKRQEGQAAQAQKKQAEVRLSGSSTRC